MDNRKQRSTPSVSIPSSFGPYHKKDLEAARAQLIRDLYKHVSNPSGILTRVKLKCGILADRKGSFSGCEPDPVTNVSFESQSCDLMIHDGFPWKKETELEEEIQHEDDESKSEEEIQHEDDGSSEKEDEPSENFTISSNKKQNHRPFQQSVNLGRLSPQPCSSSSISYNFDKLFHPSQKRKLDERDNSLVISDSESDGILVSDDESLQIVNTLSNSEQSVPKKLKTDKILEERKNEVIIVSDDSEKASVRDIKCYRCDICDNVELTRRSMHKHLKTREHYSASRYIGRKERGSIIPKFIVQRMTHIYRAGLYKHELPVCTKCGKVFTDIHICYIHQQYFHDPNEELYSLGKIRNVINVSIDYHPRCTQCKKKFSKIQNFIDHVRTVRHTNYPQPQSDETVGLACNMCKVPKLFSEFDSILNHLKEHQVSDRPRDMTVYYIEKTHQAKVMLPFVHKFGKDFTQDTLTVMKRLRKETPGEGYDKPLMKLMVRMKKSC